MFVQTAIHVRIKKTSLSAGLACIDIGLSFFLLCSMNTQTTVYMYASKKAEVLSTSAYMYIK